MSNMSTVTTVKEVKSSGSSLAVYITRELNLLNVDKGDKIEITIRKPD